MTWLEHKIPPPVIAAIIAAAMWAISLVSPRVALNGSLQWLSVGVLIASGFAIMFAAVSAFGRASTTINPVDIDKASALVTGGVFALTRNPMYLGVVMILLAIAVYLSAPLTILGPVAFAAFITRFQIIPEERVLRAKFGEAYARYTATTRRWI